MRNLYRLALMLTLFLLGFASAVAWMTLPQIKFSPRGDGVGVALGAL